MTRPGFCRGGALALMVGLFFVYLLSTSRERPWSDATPVWEVAESLLTSGSVAIATSWPPDQPRGRGGKVYAIAPVLQSLVHVPGAALRLAIGRWAPRASELSWPIACHLAPAALGALAAALFFLVCGRLGIGRGGALAAALAVALASTVWVYARTPYSEILQAACFTGFFVQTLEAERRPGWRAGAAAGAWGGLLVNAKLVYLLCLPGALAAVAWRLRRPDAQLRRPATWCRWGALGQVVGGAAAAMAPLMGLILAYNLARWGSPLATGYSAPGTSPQKALAGLSGERMLVGIWGQLFSPGKSLFLYSPGLVLSVAGLRATWRRCPEVIGLILATVGPVFLLTARLPYWAGDYAWGGRYMVFAVPVLMLPAAVLIDELLAARARPAALAVVGGVLVAGVAVQGLGNAFHWDHYIRIQRQARQRWLGVADTTGAPFPDFGGVCGACFEDMHGLQWLPPFQPIEGHWWLLHHVPFRHDWVRAEQDAPWHRYTRLRLDIASTYQAARIDWWYLEFARPADRVPGVLLLTLFGFGALAAGSVLVAQLRGQPEPLAAET
jgi:hypothetical protein